MGSIIVAMPKMEDARKIAEMLKSRGMYRIEICTTGNSVLQRVHQLDSGIVICTRNLKDMYCNELADNLSEYFEMLLLTSREGLQNCPEGVVTVAMPFRVAELVSSVEMMMMQLERRIRRARSGPRKRSVEEQECIDRAKKLLMERNSMTEQEAFRYIQKCSMDSCTNMVETAQMILMLQVE